MGHTPKEDAETLMDMLVPFAEKMLREHGEFYPYGGAMLPDGSMTMTGAYNGNEHPNSKDLYDLMAKAFKEEARTGKYKATGIVYDGMAVPPGATEKTDVIAIRLDHEAGYSVVVMIPYKLVSGDLAKGALFASKGDGDIFPVH